MNETLSRTNADTASHIESICQERLDALLRGEFSEDDFISEFATPSEDVPDSPWKLGEWINRQHNRGQVPDELFHSLESKIAEREMMTAEYGETAELHPRRKRKRRQPPAFIEAHTAPRRIVDTGAVLRDRYVIEDRLGVGGMGTVFKALDQFRGDLAETNRHVAIKVLNDDICNRPEVFAKLRREFYCAQSLSHRNIVRVYELDRDGDLAFFTMEFLEGELLSKVIGRCQPGTVSRPYAWRVVREVGAALAHAHARDVVHADLKPQNIMITHSGDVRLLDFGTSSVSVRTSAPQDAAPGAVKAGPTALTPAYASCELLEGQRADPRDDLFAFACLTYELLTGKHPFGQRRSTEARSLGLQASRPAGIGEGQWKALRLGLSWSRADRSMSVRDWVNALNQEDEEPAVMVAEPIPAEPAPAGLPVRIPARSLEPMIVDVRPAPAGMSARLMFLVALLVVILTVWIVHSRPPFDARTRGGTDVAKSEPERRPRATAAAPATPDVPRPTEAPVPKAVTAVAPPAPPAAAPRAVNHEVAPQSTPAKSAASPPPAMKAAEPRDTIPKISIASSGYWVRPSGHFAEVHVRRSAGTSGDASFVWWTEPSSAHADEDYFSQARTTQTFSAGLKSASLFIRVIPNASRRSPRVFYVVIGRPSAGHALGRLTRVPIVLLPRR